MVPRVRAVAGRPVVASLPTTLEADVPKARSPSVDARSGP